MHSYEKNTYGCKIHIHTYVNTLQRCKYLSYINIIVCTLQICTHYLRYTYIHTYIYKLYKKHRFQTEFQFLSLVLYLYVYGYVYLISIA